MVEQEDDSGSCTKRWVVNVSSKELTPATISLLQRGLKFAVTSKALPVEDIVLTMEEACRHLGEEKAASLHSEGGQDTKKDPNPLSNLAPDKRKAIHALKGDRDIMILPADKGKAQW